MIELLMEGFRYYDLMRWKEEVVWIMTFWVCISLVRAIMT
ncbi:hypothetical protein SFC43_28055 [Bacteroides sp. CR5/BHMF/2]|nr:hypothetical protein [Bacteroides sp. CR5/BHMF/2]